MHIIIFYLFFRRHSTWRSYFEPVIKNINVHLASSNDITAVYKCIDKRFVNSSLRIFNEVYSARRQFVP